MSKSQTALKYYFGKELAERLSADISHYEPSFPTDQFIREVAAKVEGLELKARVAVIAEELYLALPEDYAEAASLLMKILGPENESEEGMFTNGYFLMPVAYFVERYGTEHFELSMEAIYEITKRHTSEYAIRPFIMKYPQQSLEKLTIWSTDSNSHVRRLVSEGTRPRLPWAKRLPVITGDPSIHFQLLKPLLDDSSFYVRKSVANHLNDLSKDYPRLTLEWLIEHIHPERLEARERSERKKNRWWIARHALRTLVKSGDSEAIQWAVKMGIQ